MIEYFTLACYFFVELCLFPFVVLHTSHQSPSNKDIPPRSDVLSRDKSPRTHHSPQLMNDDERDLLAALIERGKDLRNRMLVSTIDTLNAEEEKYVMCIHICFAK